jgi:outer membrane biosynthesis protein TonB
MNPSLNKRRDAENAENRRGWAVGAGNGARYLRNEFLLRVPLRPLRLCVSSLIGVTAGGLLLAASLRASAQNADEYFHGGAQHFLTNNIPGALEVVTNGLQRFPEDEKLKKLYELLNQQQQQNQDQKQQDQDKKDDQKQDQQKQDDKKDQQSKSEQQKKDEQKKQQDAQKQEQEKKEQQAKSGDKSKDKPEEKTGEPQQVAAHQMTPQEAKQLLDAQKDDEKVLIYQPQGEPKNRTKQLKDW